MSITVTTGTNTVGVPRFSLSISSTSGAAITGITLTRTIAGATVPTIVQPTPGPSPRTTLDYLADWDTNVTYTATVTTAGGTETFTSSPAQITSLYPYAIHPFTPALSFRLDGFTTQAAGLRTLGDVARDATDTAHTIIGSPYRVYTTTGPRMAPTVAVELTTATLLEAQAVRAALNDLTPLLFRIPAALGWDFENGYYRVGQTTEARILQYGGEPARVFTLPLERVEQPAGNQQAERTYANVLADFPTYAAVRAAYTTYTNLLTDTRS